MAKAKDDKQPPENEPETPAMDTGADDAEPQAPPEPPVLVFVGDYLPDGRPAQFVPGIPARNLSQSDIDQLDDKQHKAALKSGLYRDAQEAS